MTDVNIDEPNESYVVDLNIPMEYANYHVQVDVGIYTFECRALTTRSINNREIRRIINKKTETIYFTTELSKDEGHIYNYILDRSECDIGQLFTALLAAETYFTEYEISQKTLKLLQSYVNGIDKYTNTWLSLTSKPDYNYVLFKYRMLPYFHLECKDWVKANLDAMNADYPIELQKKTDPKTGDYQDELSLVTRNNNFMEWRVLPFEKYPDMSKILEQLRILKLLKLDNLILTMICKMFLSPKFCHIIKEQKIWEILQPRMLNHQIHSLVVYCMFYSLYILRQEETIMFSQVKANSRVLFTLEQASNMPSMHTVHMDLNPYIIQLTADTQLRQTIPFYLQGNRKINSIETFKRRFNIATGGAFKGVDFRSIGAAVTGSILIPCVHTSPLENGFESIQWNRSRSFDVAYPYQIDTPSDEDMAFVNYLEYYYPSYVSLTDEDYLKQVVETSSEIPNDSTTQYEDSNPITFDIGGVASGSYLAKLNEDKMLLAQSRIIPDNIYKTPSEPELKHKPKKLKPKKSKKLKPKPKKSKKSKLKAKSNSADEESDVEAKYDPESDAETEALIKHELEASPDTEIIPKPEPETETKLESKLEPESKEPSKIIFLEDKPKVLDASTAENKTMRNALEYNSIADIDISITTKDHELFKKRALDLYETIKANCQHRGLVHIKEIKTIASIKYKIYGPGVPRPMDIFRIPYDPVKMIKKFHVHAVKMYYDNDVTLFRSCVSSLLSGVGENYKWFSCNKVPADVLLKYAQRGLSIILNRKERMALSAYIGENERWGSMLEKLSVDPDRIYCQVTADHPFFRPGMYNCGIRMNLRKFERNHNTAIHSTLVTEDVQPINACGDFTTHDCKSILPPDHRLISSVVEHLESHITESDEL